MGTSRIVLSSLLFNSTQPNFRHRILSVRGSNPTISVLTKQRKIRFMYKYPLISAQYCKRYLRPSGFDMSLKIKQHLSHLQLHLQSYYPWKLNHFWKYENTLGGKSQIPRRNTRSKVRRETAI